LKSVNGERLAVNGAGTGEAGGEGRPVYRLLFTVHALFCLMSRPAVAQIQDNSFLLEEAYNQEAGVVQHISAFERLDGGDWAYNFTQEWPLGGIRHQLSYTIPIERIEGFGTGLGDVALNYRYQLVGNPEARTVSAPRLSILLPTGDEQEGRGAGALGLQVNIPVTLVPDPQFVFHANAGATITPSARNEFGAEATTFSRNLGASLVWLLRPSFNLLVEGLWLSDESVVSDGSTRQEETTFLSPGIRAAFDLAGDLQIVPGIAYTIGISPDESEDALFLYLSFEHPFKRQ
jgi:hypothetical protein